MGKTLKIRFSIRNKILLLFSLLSLILIITESFIYFIHTKADIENRILSDLTAVARSKSAYINTLIEEDFEDAEAIANRITIREGLLAIEMGSAAKEAHKERMRESIDAALEATHTIKDVMVTDNSGNVAVSTMNFDANEALPQFVSCIDGKEGFCYRGPYFDNGVFLLELSVPVHGIGKEKDKALGKVTVKIDATRLYATLADHMGLGNTGETVMANRVDDQLVFVGPRLNRKNPGTGLVIPAGSSLARPMWLATEKKRGVVSGLDYRGEKVLAAYTYVPITGWGVVVKIDAKEASEPINELRAWTVLADCLLFIMSAIVISFFARRLSAPLRKLQEGTKMLAAGNLDYQVHVDTTDETGDLADSFNNMARSLKEITVSHDRLNIEIEHRKIAEQQLRQAIEAKSRFTSMVSHELRTPLSAIKEGIGIVHDEVVGGLNDEQKNFLNRAKANVDRLVRIINDILDFQKVDSGKLKLDIKNNDIVKIADDVYATMSPLADQKGISLTAKADAGLGAVQCDRDRIVQVLTNLVDNAIKFTDKGAVAINIALEGSYVHVSVKDTGKGIKGKDMPRLFVGFEQLEDSTERKGGTGLGLAISKEIIELHGGKMWAESEYGKWTAMHFTLHAGQYMPPINR